jgi:hypothetical protein
VHVEFIANGGVSLLLAPENEMEEALLKQMMRQDNDLTDVRSSVTVINKSYRNCVLIGRRGQAPKLLPTGESTPENEDNQEAL